MVDRKVGNPIEMSIPHHGEKNRCVNRLRQVIDDPVPVLVELGELLRVNASMSKTQKTKLVAGLEAQNILTYRENLREAVHNPDEFDIAKWYIEDFGDAQANAICSASVISSHPLGIIYERIRVAVGVLNAGHACGRKFYDFTEESTRKPSLENFIQAETDVYCRREEIARALETVGIFEKNDIELVVETPIGDFSDQEFYDYLMVYDFANSIENTRDFLTVFNRLQEMLYLGFGFAMRDTPLLREREDYYWSARG